MKHNINFSVSPDLVASSRIKDNCDNVTSFQSHLSNELSIYCNLELLPNEVFEYIDFSDTNLRDKSQGRYAVSNKGRTWDFAFNRLAHNKVSNTGKHYTRINSKGCYTATLVLSAFNKSPSKKYKIKHIDGDISNNDLANLEWAINTNHQDMTA